MPSLDAVLEKPRWDYFMDTPFQQYIKDHPELEAKNAFKVFRVYNSEMSEQDARDQFNLEIEDYIDRYESTPVLEELLNPSVKQPELPLEVEEVEEEEAE